MRHCLIALLLALSFGTALAGSPGLLPERSWCIPGMSADSACAILRSCPASHVGGLWAASADGAWLAFLPGHIADSSASLSAVTLIVMVRSPKASMLPGTVVGWCSPTPAKGEFDCRMFSREEPDGSLSSPRRFTLRMPDNDRITLTPVSGGYEFRPLRLLPYMFRSLIVKTPQRGIASEGFFRIWPSPSVSPLAPRYL